MNTAKLKIEGKNQIVVLPEDFYIEGDEVYLKKVGNAIMLISKNSPFQTLWESIELFSEDFMTLREQPTLETREELFE